MIIQFIRDRFSMWTSFTQNVEIDIKNKKLFHYFYRTHNFLIKKCESIHLLPWYSCIVVVLLIYSCMGKNVKWIGTKCRWMWGMLVGFYVWWNCGLFPNTIYVVCVVEWCEISCSLLYLPNCFCYYYPIPESYLHFSSLFTRLKYDREIVNLIELLRDNVW